MKDIDLINEAYGKTKQLDEAAPLAAAALRAGAMTAGEELGRRAVDRVVPEDSFDDDNNTALEPGERISGIKKDAIIQVIKQGLDELIKGNTGPDSPCGEREAIDLIVSSCQRKLQEMDGGIAGGY